jgi:hypothetical protein
MTSFFERQPQDVLAATVPPFDAERLSPFEVPPGHLLEPLPSVGKSATRAMTPNPSIDL